MSEVRNSFEKWALERRYDVSHNSNGGYDDETTQVAWDSWVASRVSVATDAVVAVNKAKHECVTCSVCNGKRYHNVYDCMIPCGHCKGTGKCPNHGDAIRSAKP